MRPSGGDCLGLPRNYCHHEGKQRFILERGSSVLDFTGTGFALAFSLYCKVTINVPSNRVFLKYGLLELQGAIAPEV